MRTQEQIEKYNTEINNAIFISQMMDNPGFIILNEYLLSKQKDVRYQDIFGLKTIDVLEQQKGIALMVEDLFQFFDQKKLLANNPKIDPTTGEFEILNSKK